MIRSRDTAVLLLGYGDQHKAAGSRQDLTVHCLSVLQHNGNTFGCPQCWLLHLHGYQGVSFGVRLLSCWWPRQQINPAKSPCYMCLRLPACLFLVSQQGHSAPAAVPTRVGTM